MLSIRLLITLVTLGLSIGCVTAGDGDLFPRVEVEALEGCDDPVDFEVEVLSPVNAACGTCHVTASLGNLNFGNGDGVLTAESFVSHLVDQPSKKSEKPLLESGSELNSYFIDRVLQRDADVMPPTGPPLPDEAVQALRCWVEQGAYLEDE
jgi:hypothetical protein